MIELLLSIAMNIMPMSMFDIACTTEKGANTILVTCCVGYTCMYEICQIKTGRCRQGTQE